MGNHEKSLSSSAIDLPGLMAIRDNYVDLVQQFISQLGRCTVALQEIDVMKYEPEAVRSFIRDNRAAISKLTAYVDVQTSGTTGNALEFNVFDNRLDIRLFEFETAAKSALQRLEQRELHQSPMSRRITLIVLSALSLMSSLAVPYGYQVCKKHYGVRGEFLYSSIMSLNFVSNGVVWAVALYMYRNRLPKQDLRTRALLYLLSGAIDACHMILLSVGLSNLPGTLQVP